jgi:hypothetical protein
MLMHKNVGKSNGFENNSNIEYNNENEVFIDSKQEYAKAMNSIRNNMAINIDYRRISISNTDNYFYMYKGKKFKNKPI